MKKLLHILTLFLFALTQLFAPLVHAHVDGMQGETTFHAHGVPHHLSPVDLSQCHVESYESQAISIPHQNLGDDALVIPAFHASSTHPLPPGIAGASVEPYRSLHASASDYNKPYTQAPPK
jgi:hypothetical protein